MKYAILLYFFAQHVASDHTAMEKSPEDIDRKIILRQLSRTRTVLLDDYELVTRHVATEVYAYRNYGRVSVVLYQIPSDVSIARFFFLAEEIHLNRIGSCKPRNVIVNIKYGSYPALNPDGYDFPKHFIEPSLREKYYTVDLNSDGQNKTFTIENPKPGNWYAIVYKKWEDPRSQQIAQQGLVALCDTTLYSDLQVSMHNDITQVNCYSSVEVDFEKIAYPSKFKCFAIDSVRPIQLNISLTNVPDTNVKIALQVEPLRLPSDKNNILSCAFTTEGSNLHIVTFFPSPNVLHYFTLEVIPESYSNIADCESYYVRSDLDGMQNYTMGSLMRDIKGKFFSFEYGLPTTDLEDATSLVNLTANSVTSLRFNINQFLDNGGSFTIEASILLGFKYYVGFKRPMSNGLLAFSDEDQYFRVVICLNVGHTSIPLANGNCRHNDEEKPALFVLNSTDSETIADKVIIPYPESGTWYLSFRLFCDDVVCPCKKELNGSKYYVEGNKGSNGDMLDGNETYSGESVCNATVVLSLSSTPCVNGKCSNHGHCMYNTYGGMVMSFCGCFTGYGGWDCSDSSRMDPFNLMLTSTLLLTLSNLLFVLSIYVAFIRLYYTAGVMYFLIMVFSTFYHACDAPPEISYCIVKSNLLQFGDFYCGIMCFWVTLLAMSLMNPAVKSFLQLIGAIFIALLTTWNMHSFFTFLVPVTIGIACVISTWVIDYKKNNALSFPRSYYTKWLPIGACLVIAGLVCYAFLQTEQNYKYIHSFWHMSIASCVLFLLPDALRDSDENPFLPSAKYYKLPSFRVFSRPRPTNEQND